MSEKKINSRIVHKHDTEENWQKATNFIPKQGELIIYDKDSTYNYERFKIGDGSTLVSSLPFVVNVDDALSSTSENPVQNKVVNTAITNLNNLVGDTSVSEQISNAVNNKMDKENPTGTGSFSLNRKADTTVGNYSFAEGQDTTASGTWSHAEGYISTSSGSGSHAEGASTASGDFSHSEGDSSTASGYAAHAEGGSASATSAYAHAEGSCTTASGDSSHAEGAETVASSDCAHAEGEGSTASGNSAHAEGYYTKASSEKQHVQGKYNIEDSSNTYADIIGNGTSTKRSNAATIDWSGNAWYAGDVYVGSTSGTNKDEGSKKLATEEYVDSKQVQSDYTQNDSTAADYIKNRPFYEEIAGTFNITWGGNITGLTPSSNNNFYKVSDSTLTFDQFIQMTIICKDGSEIFIGDNLDWAFDESTGSYKMIFYADWGPVVAFAENAGPNPMGELDTYPEVGIYFPADGTVTALTNKTNLIKKIDNKFLDLSSYAKTTDLSNKMDKRNPSGTGSFSLNRKVNTTVGDYSFTEGYNTTASGNNSHAEGNGTTASNYSSHAEGYFTTASGQTSHTEGTNTVASGDSSHAEGKGTKASSNWQHTQGKYNIEDASEIYADIIGNGIDDNYRSNASTIDWNGNAWYAGNVYVGSTSGKNKDEGSKKLATEEYVTTQISAIPTPDVSGQISTHNTATDSHSDIRTSISNLSALVGDTAVSTQISNAVSAKADIAAGTYTVTTAGDGAAYTASVPNISALTAGASFRMIPHTVSTTKTPTLNVNGLGAKGIRRRLSNMATTLETGYANSWLAANKPFTVVYDGTYWVVEGMAKPSAADLYGIAPQAKADASGNIITDTYATIAMLQNMLPKVTSITLGTTWNGTSSPYYLDFDVSCVTETSVVDLQPTPEQLASWQEEGLAFTTLSGNGTVRVYVAGGLPSTAMTVQIKVQEVVVV